MRRSALIAGLAVAIIISGASLFARSRGFPVSLPVNISSALLIGAFVTLWMRGRRAAVTPDVEGFEVIGTEVHEAQPESIKDSEE